MVCLTVRSPAALTLCLALTGCSWSLLTAGQARGLTLVESGQPTAALVVPDETKLVELYAALEFQHHVKLGSGAELPIVPESASADLPGGRVYFGRTRALKSAGLGGEDFGKYGYAGRLRAGSLYFYGVDVDVPVPEEIERGELLLQRAASLCWEKPIGTLLAVYDFLDTHLEARWVWPGPTGEYVPARSDLSVESYDRAGQPRYLSNHMLMWDKNVLEQRQWLLRHRFLRLEYSTFITDHSFWHYWDIYKDTHPDIFAMRPGGSRKPVEGQPGWLMAMCVSNPDLVKLKVERWRTGAPSIDGHGRNLRSDGDLSKGYIPVNENDVAGYCVCDGCRAWDAPDERFATHDYWGKGIVYPFNQGGRWLRDRRSSVLQPAPSLTDRYMRFYLAVQREAEKYLPGVLVVGQAYTNYSEPPREVALNERIIIKVVTLPAQSLWTPEVTRKHFEYWDAWQATGATLFLRPNTINYRGHNLPDFYARELGKAVRHCANTRMIGTDWDALMGQWSVQAPNFYMIGRMLQRPDLTEEQVLDEFYGGFGPAKAQVAAYFNYWDQATNDHTPEQYAAFTTELLDSEFDARHSLAQLAQLFTPDVMARGRALLDEAAVAAAGEARAEAMVRILDLGLRNAELTLNAFAAFRRLKAEDHEENLRRFADAIGAVEAFRQEHEGQYLNYGQGFIDYQEGHLWGGVLRKLRSQPNP